MIQVKQHLLRRSRFKITDVGTRYQSKARMRLPISDWHPISYCFEVIADYCSNFEQMRFEPQFGGWRATYTVRLRPIGKLVVDFPFALIELFRLVIRLRRYERILIGNRCFWRRWVSFGQIFTSPANHYFTDIGQWMPYNFVADSIHTKKLCSRLSSSEVQF